MHVKLPYTFHVTGRRPGKRTMDRVVAADWKAFDIAEVAESEAEVCATFERLENYNFFDSFALAGRAEIRYHDGHFYRAKIEDDGNPLVAENIANRPLVDYAPFGDDLKSPQVLFASGAEKFPRPTYDGETWSDETDIVAELTAKAEGLLLIDGKVWERSPEPVLIVEEEIGRHKFITVSPAFPDLYAPDKRSRYYVFSLDQMDAAVAFCESRKEHTGFDIDAKVAADVEVLAPEVLSRGHMAEDIVRHAMAFVEETGTPSMNRVTPQYSRAWQEFAESQRAASYTKADDELLRLLEAWVELAQVRAESYLPTLDRSDRDRIENEGDYCTHMALSLMERFESRPVNELAFAPATGTKP